MSSERPPQDGPDERPTLEMPAVKRPEQEPIPRVGSATRGSMDHEQDTEGNNLNEDAHFIDAKRGILAVFDGVSQGGLGEIASRTAKKELTSEQLEAESRSGAPGRRAVNEHVEHVFGSPAAGTSFSREEVEVAMHDLLFRMNTAVTAAAERAHGTRLQGWDSLATTATVAKTWQDERGKRFVTLGNVGDSRGYLLRKGKLIRLTHDHGFLQALMDAHIIMNDEDVTQSITKDQVIAAASHSQALTYLATVFGSATSLPLADIRNVILQSIGSGHTFPLNPEVVSYELEPGDSIILTTDGVHDNLVHEAMEKKALRFAHDPQGMAEALVNAAFDFTLQNDPEKELRVKPDDMTAVVLTIE